MAACVLYSYWRSSCSWRVRLALELKGIEYEYRAVHLVKDGGEQHSEGFRNDMNMMEQVPALVVDGLRLTQSVAICEYLEEAGGDDQLKLLPKDPSSRAKVRRIVEIINSGIQPLQNLSLLQVLESSGVDKLEIARNFMTKGFIALEKELVKVKDSYDDVANLYCVGPNVTLADCFLVPQVYNARRFKLDMTQFPLVVALDAKLSKLDAFRKAHPDEQPDAQV